MNKFKHLVFIDDDYPTNYYHQIIAERCRIAEENVTFQLGKSIRTTLYNGKERLRRSPRNHFFDTLNMPGMTGWEFLDLYRDEIGQTSHELLF
ncbi:MAG: hypothetical protein R3B93_28995 [Bacteroidia bacterium]